MDDFDIDFTEGDEPKKKKKGKQPKKPDPQNEVPKEEPKLPDPPKDKPQYKSIEEILNLESGQSASFDEESTKEMESKFDQAQQYLGKMKEEYSKLKDLPDEDFVKGVLKNLIERGMEMLASIQMLIVDNPDGRAVETAAAMVSSINMLLDNFTKVNVYKEKLSLEREKFNLKKDQVAIAGPAGNTTNNTIFIGDQSSIIDMLRTGGITMPGVSPKMKDASAEIIHDKKDDKDE